MDISGPYKETSRGDMYIISFVDWLTIWPDAYAVEDKRDQTVVNLILTNFFQCMGPHLAAGDCMENVNTVMKETLK